AGRYRQPSGGEARVRRGRRARWRASQRSGGTGGHAGGGHGRPGRLGDRGARRPSRRGRALQERRGETGAVLPGPSDEGVARQGGPEAGAASPGGETGVLRPETRATTNEREDRHETRAR